MSSPERLNAAARRLFDRAKADQAEAAARLRLLVAVGIKGPNLKAALAEVARLNGRVTGLASIVAHPLDERPTLRVVG